MDSRILFIVLVILAIIPFIYLKKIFFHLKNNYKNKFKKMGLDKVSNFYFELNPIARFKLCLLSWNSLFGSDLKLDKTLDRFLFMYRLFFILFSLSLIISAVILILFS